MQFAWAAGASWVGLHLATKRLLTHVQRGATISILYVQFVNMKKNGRRKGRRRKERIKKKAMENRTRRKRRRMEEKQKL